MPAPKAADLDAATAAMLAMMPAEPDPRDERWRVHALLAHLVAFHRREQKSYWWAYYERQGRSHEELVDDADCLADLRRTRDRLVPDGRAFLHAYELDEHQETKLRTGDDWIGAHDVELAGTIHALERGRVVLRTTQRTLPERLSIMPGRPIRTAPIETSIARTAERWAAQAPLSAALTTLLYREPPRLEDRELGAPLVDADEEPLAAALRLTAAMQDTVLAIQGPPGCGKTHVAAACVAALIADGRRVGVTSQSHHAIDHLMKKAIEVARRAGHAIRALKVKREPDSPIFEDDGVAHAPSMSKVSFAAASAPQLVGGTAWAFADPGVEGQLDYLFIDEAGQFSLANTVAVAPAARNLVLVGDQMQLPQVIQGAHPPEVASSALEYLLGDAATIDPALGLFLPRTHRLHPLLCRFVSDAIYEGKLTAEPGAARRVLRGAERCRHVPVEAGLYFYPVEHEDNAQESEEEVAAIVEIVAALKARALEVDGRRRPLGDEDLLVVAPYNLQVRRLREALPGLRVGSVDLFQGQEAAVAIVSMCASNAEAAPRGLEFLLDRNRLNVAVSRAQALAIVVGSPALGRGRATTVRQMKLLSLYCRVMAQR